MTARIATLCFAFFASTANLASAQLPEKLPPAPMPTAAAPTIRDEGGYWSEAEKAKMNMTIEDLFRRCRCQVIVESYPKESNAWANGANLDDPAALGRALDSVRNKRFDDARRQDKTCPCVVIIGGPGRYSWTVGFPNLTREEQQKVSEGIPARVVSNGNSLSRGLPDILTFIGEACQEKVAPSPGPATDKLEAAKPNLATTAFRQVVLVDGGLSPPDLEAVEAARGDVSYEAITEFVKDQIKEGRKGADLKDDLLTFIKLLKEKK